MSPISNFKQAMKELTGFDEELGEGRAKSGQASGRTGERAETAAESSSGAERMPEYRESFAVPERRAQRERLSVEIPAFNEHTGTLITGTMLITGNVEGSDQVKVDGSITGDLHTTAPAVVNGKILGNIATDKLSVSGTVKGAVCVSGDACIEGSAVVVGDVKAGSLAARGKIKGNLRVEQITDVSETAIIVGDIDTGELNSERGCVINGSVTTRAARGFDFDEEKLFSIGE